MRGAPEVFNFLVKLLAYYKNRFHIVNKFIFSSGLTDGKVNVALQKKISSTSEAAIILEGGVAFQEKPLAIFVKLKVRNGSCACLIISYPACKEIAQKRPAITILR